jgi:hypothetical protein
VEDYRDDYVLPNGWTASVMKEENSPLFIEVDVEVFADVDELDEDAYDEKEDEFAEKFLSTAKVLAKAVGKADFCDGAAARRFPSDQQANWLALWQTPSARCMFQQKHEDRELPFRLCIVITPLRRKK